MNTLQHDADASAPEQKLELLVCLPPEIETSENKPPILFIHGAFCSAHDYQYFLPYFASRGYPSYALSLRGHGKSWTPGFLKLNLLTTTGHHASDIKSVLGFILDQHGSSAQAPIVCGHSFGGGYLQHFLSQETRCQRGEGKGPKPVSGLILLGSLPIWGGAKQIMKNWERVETRAKDTTIHGARGPSSTRTSKDTCRSKVEGLRVGLAAFWPMGTAQELLAAVEGIAGDGGGRKVLFVAAERDPLVTVEVVKQNAEAYLKDALEGGQEDTAQVVIPDSGHHLMMDTPWKHCADEIIRWIEVP